MTKARVTDPVIGLTFDVEEYEGQTFHLDTWPPLPRSLRVPNRLYGAQLNQDGDAV